MAFCVLIVAGSSFGYLNLVSSHVVKRYSLLGYRIHLVGWVFPSFNLILLTF